MYKVLVGTTSESKLNVVKKYFTNDFDIISKAVKSEITEQPLDEETTIIGAKNRSKNSTIGEDVYDFSIGMEGGLSYINNIFFLICIVVIFKDNKFYIGKSEKIPLPKSVSEDVRNGKEFGIVIREYREKIEDKDEIELVDKLIDRQEYFLEALGNAFKSFNLGEYE